LTQLTAHSYFSIEVGEIQINMIIDFLATLLSIIMLPLVLFINAILSVIPVFVEAPEQAVVAMFTNMGIFNTVLPVTEIFVFAGLAIGFKLTFFVFKVTFIVYNFLTDTTRTFFFMRK